MLTRKRARNVASDAAETMALYAEQLSDDPKLRQRLIAAVSHAEAARRRALPATGMTATAARLATDRELHAHLREIADQLQHVNKRVRRKRSHRMRNTMLVALAGGGAAAVALVPNLRRRLTGSVGSAMPSGGPTTIEEQIEVGVPISTAYNQWTQFEDFPLFMEGVDHVDQLGDTELHWVASIAGKTNEWDAKILEQHPDRQISWISEDGKKTRGTVTFEPLGEGRTLIRLSMSYQAEGPAETL